MRENALLERAFSIVDNNPDWRKVIKKEVGVSIANNMLKYVQRYDLRAPGEQVRLANNKISHCRELISEFE